MATARRRPPRGGRGPAGRGRGQPEPPPEEVAPPEPPLWERAILSKTFRYIVIATFGATILAFVIFLVGPGTISQAISSATTLITRRGGQIASLGSVAVAQAIQEEGRRLWLETATPYRTPEPTETPRSTPTELPTPPPPRRQLTTPIPEAPAKPLQPGQPVSKPGPPAQLPIEDAVAGQREYFQYISQGDARRALQYWSPEAAPEARSALDAAVARGEKYTVRGVSPRVIQQIGGADLTVQVDVIVNEKTTTVEHRYQWRFIEGQWYITTRLQ